MTTVNHDQSAATPELLWGAKAIGKAIGRSEKAAFQMLEAGKLPGARKVAGRWAFNPKIFFASFEGVAAAKGVAA
jgi:hypothetical protein